MAKIDDILRRAVERRASDIHFSADNPCLLRQDGDLVPLDDINLSDADLQVLLHQILSEKEKARLIENKNLDKSYSVPDCGNFRVNIFYSRRGIGAVIRWLPTKMPEIDNLGLPPVVKKLAELPKGLLLVTGPTGSGKSTTLASMINYINTNFQYHILTVEDPVEFVHPCKKSLINQREIGQSCLTFADALKYALREDPDVILVGEMRDLETISLALTAAETGHLVFGTLHTRGAASAVDRIIESFPATERPLVRTMLAESLRGVISQILIKAKDGQGRVAAYEIMVTNYAISNLIREGKTFQIPSILQTSRGDGNLQMEQHIRQLMAEGKIDAVEGDAILSGMMRANASSGPPPGAAPTNAVNMMKPGAQAAPAGPPGMQGPGTPSAGTQSGVHAAPTPPISGTTPPSGAANSKGSQVAGPPSLASKPGADGKTVSPAVSKAPSVAPQPSTKVSSAPAPSVPEKKVVAPAVSPAPKTEAPKVAAVAPAPAPAKVQPQPPQQKTVAASPVAPTPPISAQRESVPKVATPPKAVAPAAAPAPMAKPTQEVAKESLTASGVKTVTSVPVPSAQPVKQNAEPPKKPAPVPPAPVAAAPMAPPAPPKAMPGAPSGAPRKAEEFDGATISKFDLTKEAAAASTAAAPAAKKKAPNRPVPIKNAS